MATALPFEIYELLEKKLGREEAKEFAKAVEASLNTLAIEKKLELKDELSKELASKADLAVTEARLAGKIDADIARLEGKINSLEWKLKLYFLFLACLIILVSPRALDLIAKLFGVVK